MPTIGEGLYMGAEKLTGQALAQLAALAKAITDATKRFRSQQKKRGKVTRWGKLLKTIFPGFGHVVDLALDRYAQDRYNLIREKDKAKIREAEGFYTGKEGTKFIDALQEQEDLIDVNFGEAVASEVADYAKSWAGQQMLKKTGIGSITEKLKSNLPKWMTFGIPGGEGEDLPHGLKDVAGEVVMEKTDLKDIATDISTDTRDTKLAFKTPSELDVTYDPSGLAQYKTPIDIEGKIKTKAATKMEQAFTPDLIGGYDPNIDPVEHYRHMLDQDQKNVYIKDMFSESDYDFAGNLGMDKQDFFDILDVDKRIFNPDSIYDTLREQHGYEIDFYGNVKKKKALGGLIEKYEHGGSVQNESVTPTITDYFSKQGKTLGGSDRESLAEKLGRK